MSGRLLFRAQAVERRRRRLDGVVSLAPSSAAWSVALVVGLTTIAVALLLIFGRYARKETVQGWLVPNKGVVALYAEAPGVVEVVHVTEGERVNAGAPLVTLSLHRPARVGESGGATLKRALRDEESALKTRLRLIKEKASLEKAALERKLALFRAEEAHIDELATLQAEKAALAKKRFETVTKLAKRGSVAQATANDRRRDWIEARAAHKSARLQSSSRAIARAEIEAALDSLRNRREREFVEIEERLAQLAFRREEVAGRSRRIVTAPIAGVVATIYSRPGQQTRSDTLQATLLPKGARLEAELYAPSRAIGFVAVGQSVRLLYDAFSYQRFGAAGGEISQISGTVLSPADAPSALGLREPTFRIRVRLKRADVDAYGQRIPLRSGMKLRADLILEDRTIWQVITDPLRAAAR